MKRDLLKQMCHEWRDNIWMILGLVVITAAVWTLATEIYGNFRKRVLPIGADIENVYKLKIAVQTPGSPNYIEAEGDAKSAKGNDIKTLLETIRRSPYVEAAALSYFALPYEMRQPQQILCFVNPSGDTLRYTGIIRYMTPEMIDVLHLKSITGKSEHDIKAILKRGELLVSNVFDEWVTDKEREFVEVPVSPKEINGQKVLLRDQEYRIGDIIQQIRRSDYDVIGSLGMIISPLFDDRIHTADAIAIRIKPGTAEKFRQEFESNTAMQQHGNVYLIKLQKLKDVANLMQEDEDISMRTTSSLIIMLILIVILGIMGIFWFRIQQRISEFAIRKVCGASSVDIFRRVITEALILLLIATIAAGVICWPLMIEFLEKESKATLSDIFITEIIVMTMLAIGITLSVWWPARKAMKIEPAIAIKDE